MMNTFDKILGNILLGIFLAIIIISTIWQFSRFVFGDVSTGGVFGGYADGYRYGE